MDPAGLGALIGISVMACAVCVVFAREKGSEWVSKLKKRYQTYTQQKQPLLPVTKTNPILVRTQSKQFQMKQLLSSK